MLRSFLARPRPLLSYLRRHDCCPVARQLGRRRADQIISRTYTSTKGKTDSRQHLYVVLDDWNKGFSIHKLDLDDGSDGDDLTLRAPVHRQATGHHNWKFAALGSKIVAAGMIKANYGDDYVTLVYDTKAAGLSIVPRLPAALHRGWALATAAGNRLYTFEISSRGIWEYDRDMHILEDAPAPADAFLWGTRDHWSWTSIRTPLPFNVFSVESIAVHPEGEGRTFFMSVRDRSSLKDTVDNVDPYVDRASTNERSIGTSRTFSYDSGTGEWRCHGDWDLPFYGQAHYDNELDVWVGLHKIYEQPYQHATDGYLCSCDVASPDGNPGRPAWKLSTEGLLDRYTLWPVANLLYMGGSNYCLVELMRHEGHCTNVDNKCVIRVARFRLKYGKKGELVVTDRRPDRSYLFTSVYESHEMQAFWM